MKKTRAVFKRTSEFAGFLEIRIYKGDRLIDIESRLMNRGDAILYCRRWNYTLTEENIFSEAA